MSEKHFFLGAMAGFVVGLLFAPQSGKKTREETRTYYFEMKDKILENLSEIKDVTRETYENVVNTVVRGYEDAKLITSAEASQIREELKQGYNRIKDLISEPTMPEEE